MTRPFVSLLQSEPLGFAKNLQVVEPTTSTLNVRWDPAEGTVREYIVIWVPAAGGEQDVVRPSRQHQSHRPRECLVFRIFPLDQDTVWNRSAF